MLGTTVLRKVKQGPKELTYNVKMWDDLKWQFLKQFGLNLVRLLSTVCAGTERTCSVTPPNPQRKVIIRHFVTFIYSFFELLRKWLVIYIFFMSSHEMWRHTLVIAKGWSLRFVFTIYWYCNVDIHDARCVHYYKIQIRNEDGFIYRWDTM